MNKSTIITAFLVCAFMGIVCSNVHALQPVTKEEMRARVPALLEELNTASRGKRWHIIHDLGYSEDKRVVDTLIHIFQDESESESIHRAALEALVVTKDEEKAIPFVRSLLNDKVYGISAAVLLNRYGFADKKVISMLTIYAREGHPEVLYEIKLDTTTLQPYNVYPDYFNTKKILKELLNHKQDIVRMRAAEELFEISEKDAALKTIYDLLKSTNAEVSGRAKRLLKQRADEENMKELK